MTYEQALSQAAKWGIDIDTHECTTVADIANELRREVDLYDEQGNLDIIPNKRRRDAVARWVANSKLPVGVVVQRWGALHTHRDGAMMYEVELIGSRAASRDANNRTGMR